MLCKAEKPFCCLCCACWGAGPSGPSCWCFLIWRISALPILYTLPQLYWGPRSQRELVTYFYGYVNNSYGKADVDIWTESNLLKMCIISTKHWYLWMNGPRWTIWWTQVFRKWSTYKYKSIRPYAICAKITATQVIKMAFTLLITSHKLIFYSFDNLLLSLNKGG